MPPRAGGGHVSSPTVATSSSSSSSSSPWETHNNVEVMSEALRKVLKTVRNFKIKDRKVAREFERLPDAQEHPQYYATIRSPISLKELEKGARPGGEYCTPQTFCNGFALMVKNAQIYNRSTSTIHKDARRMYEAFKHAMMDELSMIKPLPPTYTFPDVETDEDEEDAWARDLRQRSHLAFYERSEYQKIHERLAAERARVGRPTVSRELVEFCEESLVVRWVQSKASQKQLNREAFANESGELNLPDTARGAYNHDTNTCDICCPMEDISHASALTTITPTIPDIVLTPSFTELHPPAPPRRGVGSSFAAAQTNNNNATTRLTGPKRTKMMMVRVV